MDRIKKSCVEKIYQGLQFLEFLVVEVEDRDPMEIVNDGRIQGFRFYDQVQAVGAEVVYDVKRMNFSNWIYFGKRLTLEEVKEQCGKDPEYSIFVSNMEHNHYDFICLTQAGTYLPMGKDDMTFDEYIAEHNKEKGAVKSLKS